MAAITKSRNPVMLEEGPCPNNCKARWVTDQKAIFQPADVTGNRPLANRGVCCTWTLRCEHEPVARNDFRACGG